MEKMEMKTENIAEEKLKVLKELFPEAVIESNEGGEPAFMIDKEALESEINTKVIGDKQEKYIFTWPDKTKSIIEANLPITDTLRPIKEDRDLGAGFKERGSVDFDNTENLYIEGDNLKVLKLLRNTYLGQIKMIYIDPPYNTGKDFVYKDNFKQGKEDYLENSDQYDKEGNRLVQNLESNGRFHTDWLNMIYPRLKIARDLLTDDGVIFISIDDNEVANLKKVCDEIFGESNQKGLFVWRKTHTQTNIGDFARVKEYILCYSKNIKNCIFNRIPLTNLEEYRYEDENGLKFRRVNLIDSTRGRYEYDIINPNGNIVNGKWMKPKDDILKMIENNEVYWAGETPYGKNYLIDMKKKGQIANDFLTIDYGTNQRSTMHLDSLMGSRVFDFSKPLELMKHFINLSTNDSDYILDFFSGSSTLAHACLEYNAEDGGKRKFIMVQLPEECDKDSEAYKAGYQNICEIGKERIRRAGDKIKNDSPMTTLDLDTGFRVLRLDSSNMKNTYYFPNDITQEDLELFSDTPIKGDRGDLDLLFQVMNELGAFLSDKIEELDIQGAKVYNVNKGYIYFTNTENISNEAMTEIAKNKPVHFVMVAPQGEEADNTLTNYEQIFRTNSPDTKVRVI